MTWARIDDLLPHHPKVMAAQRLAPAVFGYYVASICYARRHLTDGVIARSALPLLLPATPRPTKSILSQLQALCLWEPLPDGTGWMIHDFLEWNETAAEIRHRRAEDSARKRGSREAIRPVGIRAESTRTPSGLRPESRRRGEERRGEPEEIQNQRRAEEESGGEAGSAPASPGALTPDSSANGQPEIRPPIVFRVNALILAALDKAPRLGAVSRLRRNDWWQAEVRANHGVDFVREILKAEAWLTAHPERRYGHLDRFFHTWLGRAEREEATP